MLGIISEFKEYSFLNIEPPFLILEEGLSKIKEKKTKVKKVKEVTEQKPKKEPKIKAKKSTLSNKVIIEQSPKEAVSFD